MQFETTPAETTKTARNAAQAEIERLTAEFLNRGGKITTAGESESTITKWMDGRWFDAADSAKILGVPVGQLKNSISTNCLASCPAPLSQIWRGRRMWPEAVLIEWMGKYGKKKKIAPKFRDGQRGEVAA